jgi:nitroreductase
MSEMEPPAAPKTGEPLPLPERWPELQSYLANRRSVSANELGEPGPGPEEIAEILQIAARVPDHKKLAPWRFIVFQGDARAAFGHILALILKQREPDASEARLEIERQRLLRAPVVIATISRAEERPGVPEWEQILSAGAANMNLIHAAAAHGYSANWITEWYSYDPAVAATLGLAPHERIAGFVYIGTARQPPVERDRPRLAEITSFWPLAPINI